MQMKTVVFRGLCLMVELVLMASLAPASWSLAQRATPDLGSLAARPDVEAMDPADTGTLGAGEWTGARLQADPDVDWVTFEALSGTTYLIEAQVPEDSPSDVVLELYDRCGGLPSDGQGYDFAPGVRMEFTAIATGPVYLKLYNDKPSVAGSDVAYHLSVRALHKEPTPGALVLVAGRLKETAAVQDNIHNVTAAVRRLFLANGYDDDRIYYLANRH